MKRTLPLMIALCTPVILANTDPMRTLEPLQGVEFSAQGATIQVRSTGCTKASHFFATLTPEHNSSLTHLSIYRSKPDRCRAKPKTVSIPLHLDLEKIHAIHVENSFSSQSY